MENGEFQSIYNLHELLITLLIKNSTADSAVLPLSGKMLELDEMFKKH